MSDISVSIVNHNNRELLLGCLETLHASLTPDVEVEIVVLDNASDDGSVEAVRKRFPDVCLLAQGFRAGFGANHNTVIRASTGRYVYVLNEDTFSKNWGFAQLVSEMDAHEKAGALGPRIVDPRGRHQESAWRFPTPAVSALGMPTLGQLGIVQSKGVRPRAVDWVLGAALLLRREALDGVGLFDEDFFMYFEEVDLCLRLRRAGWEVRYFPAVTVAHYDSQSGTDIAARRVNELWRGRHRYWRKHHSRVGARIAALATGAQYLGAAAAGTIVRDGAYRARMRLHARNAWRVSGPGLRELAEDWNRHAGAQASDR